MVNTALTGSRGGGSDGQNRPIPPANARNEAGGAAYAMSDRAALAQLAVTGCLNSTYHTSRVDKLDEVLALAQRVEVEFVAKVALWARRRGFMKDMPALLCAVLAVRDVAMLRRVFPHVIDNAKMLRNFVQLIRSGVTGRRSLGRAPKRLVTEWIERRSAQQLLNDSVGNQPSLADVIRLAHPSPGDDPQRQALFSWLLGRDHDPAQLPEIVQHFERFKRGESPDAPDVNFMLLTGLPLDTAQWTDIARRASWQQLRMNLNTLARHGVFAVEGMTELVAAVLRDPGEVAKARVFPYQLMVASQMASAFVPMPVRDALVDAMELATANVPSWDGRVVTCVDVSGSMKWPVTGGRGSATSSVRCVDVAALIASVVKRRNPQAKTLGFDTRVYRPRLGAMPVIQAAQKLASLGGGGTACSAPLQELNRRREKVDLLVFVSDNESWRDTDRVGTRTMREWAILKERCPKAKMVCIDIAPVSTVQAPASSDVLHVGGFSDVVFDVVRSFIEQPTADHCVQRIDALNLDQPRIDG